MCLGTIPTLQVPACPPPGIPLTLLADFRTRPEPKRRQTMGGDTAARPAVGVASLEDRGQFPVLR